jgi:hypothetical protein
MKVQVKKENKSWTHDASRKKRKRKDSHVHKRVKIERGSCKRIYNKSDDNN